ncbi:uncharacterized protein LOC143278123 [Babylonia areolata]|uniref:uncharacterized protein LOC143278123 n=1 Tax=Babylonia areolata TaxID=304850 RepID=UPI003FD43CC8
MAASEEHNPSSTVSLWRSTLGPEDGDDGPKTSSATHNMTTTTTTTKTVTGTAAMLNDITIMLWYVVPPLVLLSGTFGNMMIVAVMQRMRRASKSTACLSLYFTALAWSDQCLLVVALPFYWVDKAFSWPPSFHRFDLLCWIPKFLWSITGITSAWFLVAMTYQRVTSVVAPHRVGVLCTVRRGKVIVAFIVVASCAQNVHFLFTWVYWPEYGQCQYRQKYMYVLDVLEWLDMVWASLLPFVLLATGNVVLVWQVIQSKRLSGKLRAGGGAGAGQQGTSSTDRVHSMTLTLILTSAAFLVLTLPLCVFDVALQTIYAEISSNESNAVVNLARFFVVIFWIGASASNFYLYILSGKKFREESKRILCCGGSDNVK